MWGGEHPTLMLWDVEEEIRGPAGSEGTQKVPPGSRRFHQILQVPPGPLALEDWLQRPVLAWVDPSGVATARRHRNLPASPLSLCALTSLVGKTIRFVDITHAARGEDRVPPGSKGSQGGRRSYQVLGVRPKSSQSPGSPRPGGLAMSTRLG